MKPIPYVDRPSADKDSPCNYLPHTYYQISDSEKISDVLGDDWLYKWTPKVPVFISAQTGFGKNTFIREVLIPNFLKSRNTIPERKILILSNRTALNRQTKLLIAETIDYYTGRSDIKYVAKLREYTDIGLDKFEDFGNIIVCSYQSLLGNKILENTYDFVIIDECHFFISDAEFNEKTEKILDTIIDKFRNSIRIYMSATPDEIITQIIKKEVSCGKVNDYVSRYDDFGKPIARFSPRSLPFFLKRKLSLALDNYYEAYVSNIQYGKYDYNFFANGFKFTIYKPEDDYTLLESYADIKSYELHNDKCAWIYDTLRNYDYLNIKYFSVPDQTEKTDTLTPASQVLLEIILESLIINPKSKWVVFVTNKEDGKELAKEINANEKIEAIFVSAESKISNKDDGKGYSQIIETESFAQNVLISTAVLDNGINIQDASVKNIAILNFNRVQFLQMLGRARVQKDSIDEKKSTEKSNGKITLYLAIYNSNQIQNLLKKQQRKLIELLDFSYCSPRQKKQIHESKLRSKHALTSILAIDSDETLTYNSLAKVKLRYDIAFLKNIISKINPSMVNVELSSDEHDTVRTILKDILQDDKQDLLHQILRLFPSNISEDPDILKTLAYLRGANEAGYIPAILDTIPPLATDRFIDEKCDNFTSDELQEEINKLIYISNVTSEEPQKDISATEYSYLKKYLFFSNKINAIRNKMKEDHSFNESKLEELIGQQQKYRLLFNHHTVKYDIKTEDGAETSNNTQELNIIKEQLSWLERLNDFDEANYYRTQGQKNLAAEKEENIKLLHELLEKHAILRNEYTEVQEAGGELKNTFLREKGLCDDTQKEFRASFTTYYKKAFGKRKQDKGDDYGANNIRECLSERNLPYELDPAYDTKKKTYWLVIKSE